MSKAERRRRAHRERQQQRALLEELKKPWVCACGDTWPPETPIGLCGCLRKGDPRVQP